MEEKKEALIIHYFFTEKDNTQKNISEMVGVSIQKVNRVLNKHLKINFNESES